MKTLFYAVVAVIVVLFATRNLPWSLDSYDQAKQAYVSYQMIESGDWWFQKTPDGETATKPPLAGWMSAALYFATAGRWLAAWVLPSLLSGLLLVWLVDRGTCLIARRSTASLDAWLLRAVAAAAVGLNLMAPHLAALVRTDMLLGLLLFVPGYMIWRKQKEQAAWTTAERLIFAAAVLASMLTKGPLIGVFVIPGLVGAWTLQRRWGQRFYGWCGWWPWVLPLAVFLLWAMAGIRWQPGFYEDVVLKEFAGRVTGEHKSQPVYYYVGQLLYRAAPWSVLLAVLALAPRGRELTRNRPEILWLACWTLGALVVMSLVPSKRTDRIFPVIPPAALWMIELLAAWNRDRLGRFPLRRTLAVLVVLSALFSGIYAGANVAQAYREDQGGLRRFAMKARAEAQQRGWALAVVAGRDEGVPMYAGVRQFSSTREARRLWHDGKISGLIVERDRLRKMADDLPGGEVLFESPPSSESGEIYLFLGRAVE